jgi:hypothetical protein
MTYDEYDPRDAEIESLKAQLAEAKKAPAPEIDTAALNAQIKADMAAKIQNESIAERQARIERHAVEATSVQDFERRLAADGLTTERGHYTRSDRYPE